jgi:TetR/AcrR family transcriptional regulator, mexJK operon transcriptional repressor
MQDLSLSAGRLDRRSWYLERAEKVFLEKGFAATTMATIATHLGVAKGTLYNYFLSKEDLFIAIVERHCDYLSQALSTARWGMKSFEETLNELGKGYVGFVYSDEQVAWHRMIVGIVVKMPRIGSVFYERALMVAERAIVSVLEGAQESKLLKFDDSTRAARHFIALCSSSFEHVRCFDVMPYLDKQKIEAEVSCAVGVFLAAYRNNDIESLIS